MKIRLLFALTVLMTITSYSLRAQSAVEISSPELEVRDNRIVISYRILRSSENDKFRIWVEATGTNDRNLNATSLSGDVGSGITGGGTKQISWNYENDGVTLNDDIFIQVFGEMIAPQVSDPVTDHVTDRGISKTGAVLRSVALPGLGLTTMTGKPHWIKGVAGYGAIASAVIFNKMGASNYTKYLDSSDETELSDLLDAAEQQQKISEYSAYAAIGIWIIDIGWTLLSNGNSSVSSYNGRDGLNFGTGYEPTLKMPLVALRYNF